MVFLHNIKVRNGTKLKMEGKKNEEDIDKDRKKNGQKVFFFTSLFLLLGLGGGIVFVVGFGWIRKCFPYLVSFVMKNIVITVVMIKLTMVFKGLMNH